MMHLDILIPTYRRAALLARALGGIARAPGAEGLTPGARIATTRARAYRLRTNAMWSIPSRWMSST